jgi:hypothetical protein
MSGILIPRCEVCRQRLLCVDGQEVDSIGAARIFKVDRLTGTVSVQCVCGWVLHWERPGVMTGKR